MGYKVENLTDTELMVNVSGADYVIAPKSEKVYHKFVADKFNSIYKRLVVVTEVDEDVVEEEEKVQKTKKKGRGISLKETEKDPDVREEMVAEPKEVKRKPGRPKKQ